MNDITTASPETKHSVADSSRFDLHRLGPIIAVIALAVWYLSWMIPTVFAVRSGLVGGVRYWFLGDDAEISMRYARNFAEGFGPVWNHGQRVEGFSNPLLVFIMTLVHLSGVPDRLTALPILAMNITLA